MIHGIGHLPSTIIKQGKEKAKKEAANKKKVYENAKKVEANRKKVKKNSAKVRLNKADTELVEFFRKIPKSQTFLKSGGTVAKDKEGGDKKWIQKATASIKRRGTEGKCTPITKPGCTGRAKALAKTFKKMAAARKGK
jgi:hypothetical protein